MITLLLSFQEESNQVLFAGSSRVKEVILNRPMNLNVLNYQMVYQITKNLQLYESDSIVKLVILKANGKAFCAGGDVKSVIVSSLAGHWSYSQSFYKKLLILSHLISTYNKPLVSLINGVVMGGGAGISIHGRFRIVTEKAVFAMPEAAIGHVPDVGASYFLSRLPGYLGEYLGLTGARLDGAEMVACGLATHFVPSMSLNSMENALRTVTSSDISAIATLIDQFTEIAHIKEDSPLWRLETINKCFSNGTVEEIILSLENEAKINATDQKWITNALSSMRSSSPTSLKLVLRSIRGGRVQNIEQCLIREFNVGCHLVRRTVNNDFYEGARAKLFDKDNKPKWDPSKLEEVSEEMVEQCFRDVDDDNWQCLVLPARSNVVSKL